MDRPNESRLIGCGDNFCMIVKPTGMATNDGCRCVPRHLPTKEQIRLNMALQILGQWRKYSEFLQKEFTLLGKK